MTDDNKPSGTKWTKLMKQLKEDEEEDGEEGYGDEKGEIEHELQSQTIISRSDRDGMSGNMIFLYLLLN